MKKLVKWLIQGSVILFGVSFCSLLLFIVGAVAWQEFNRYGGQVFLAMVGRGALLIAAILLVCAVIGAAWVWAVDGEEE